MNTQSAHAPCCDNRCDNVDQVTDQVVQRAERDALISAQAAANMRALAQEAVHSINPDGKSGREVQALAIDAIRKIFIAQAEQEA